MFDNIKNIEIISSFHKNSKSFIKIENRKCHAFLLRIQGNMLYKFPEENITVKEGEIIFIPKGSTYTATALSDIELYTSINFQAAFQKEPHASCYSLEDFYDAPYISNCFSDMWNLGLPSEKYKSISVFYSLLSYISSIESGKQKNKNKFEIIEPAISYLKEHIYDCSLKTHKLHHLCGISNTYFRQLFISKFDTTPHNYIISKRLSQARAIILSGDFSTFGEVALSVGYNDALYFGKAFKKAYGVSPTEANKDQ